MNQDTRKDRRVKIVSLNVRYKSATVDEFIENHAHDVSRGGIFIKTANPFPPGTLLKFEIRLASDQAVIAGVGRVVWKRDTGSSNTEHPAGMGVKFIKIDDPSKAVIDRLVNSRADAGISFEDGDPPAASNDAATAKTTPPPPLSSPMSPRSTSTGASGAPPRSGSIGSGPGRGLEASEEAARTPPGAATATSSSKRPSPLPSFHSSSAPPRPNRTSAASSRPGGSSPAGAYAMFPKTEPEKEMPPKEEQTVMRQAAELLEDALREAGGSIDEIGQSPLFPSSVGASPAAQRPAVVTVLAAEETPAAVEAPVVPPAAEARTQEDEKPAPSDTPAPVARDSSVPSAAPVRNTPLSVRPAAGVPARAASASSSHAAKADPKKKGKKTSGAGPLLFAAVAAAAIVGFVFRGRLLGTGATPPEPVPTAANPVPANAPPATTPAVVAQSPQSPPPTEAAGTPAEAPAASASKAREAPAVGGPPPTPAALKPANAGGGTGGASGRNAAQPTSAGAPRAAHPAPTKATAPASTSESPDGVSASHKSATPSAAEDLPPDAPKTPSASSETGGGTGASGSSKAPSTTQKSKPAKPSDDNPY